MLRYQTRWVRMSSYIVSVVLICPALSGCPSSSGGDGFPRFRGAFGTGGTAAQQAYIKAPNAETDDLFGDVVAIDGDTIVVGAPYESSNQTTITNGSTASADNSAARAGAAYVFTRTGTTWTQEAFLKAPNAETNDIFGFSIAIAGNTIVVGAPDEDSNQTTITNGPTASADNSANGRGAAYVFTRTGTTWTQEAYLKPPQTVVGSFGHSVAIDGDTIVVGTDNIETTYVFTRSGTIWTHQADLTAPNADNGDFFGAAIAIAGDTIVVGAYGEESNQITITNGPTASTDNSAPFAGAAYVFKRTGTTWAQEAYLKAPNAEAGDQFGFSVGIAGDTIVVGAYREDSNQTAITNGPTASADNSAIIAGAAYVFARNGTTWTQEAYLKPSNTEANDQFGLSVAIAGDIIVVGARSEDSNQTTITNGPTASADNSAPSTGAAYVFTRTGTAWTQQAYLKAPNANTIDEFGHSVAIAGDTIVVGAHREDSNQTTITNGSTASADNSAIDSGAAYAFTLQ